MLVSFRLPIVAGILPLIVLFLQTFDFSLLRFVGWWLGLHTEVILIQAPLDLFFVHTLQVGVGGLLTVKPEEAAEVDG